MHASPFLKVPHVERIASNKSAFAIWDRFPASPGHALVVPHRLISTWWEASEEERSDLFGLVEVVREIVSERHDPDGYNIGINIGININSISILGINISINISISVLGI